MREEKEEIASQLVMYCWLIFLVYGWRKLTAIKSWKSIGRLWMGLRRKKTISRNGSIMFYGKRIRYINFRHRLPSKRKLAWSLRKGTKGKEISLRPNSRNLWKFSRHLMSFGGLSATKWRVSIVPITAGRKMWWRRRKINWLKSENYWKNNLLISRKNMRSWMWSQTNSKRSFKSLKKPKKPIAILRRVKKAKAVNKAVRMLKKISDLEKMNILFYFMIDQCLCNTNL